MILFVILLNLRVVPLIFFEINNAEINLDTFRQIASSIQIMKQHFLQTTVRDKPKYKPDILSTNSPFKPIP